MVNRLVRWALTAAGVTGGFILTYYGLWPLELLADRVLEPWEMALTVGLGTVVGGIVGYVLAPWVLSEAASVAGWLVGRLTRTPTPDLVAGVVGLVVGLVIANLVRLALGAVPVVGPALAIAVYAVLGYVGLVVGLKKRDDLAAWISAVPRMGRDRGRTDGPGTAPKLLDTSVIIDGRIADVCAAGFIEGPLYVPAFVLEELRRIADSTDPLRRNRGRRGLDVLNRIQKQVGLPVQVVDRDAPLALDVDSKLIRLARQMNAKILTNDYNLNKVAELQGVPVLNLNELANALKPVVLPGEEMVVHLIRDGKEAGQGVGYLDDGTMIVVDGGKKHIGEAVGVVVTSVLQTAAGRMIFARPKVAEKVS